MVRVTFRKKDVVIYTDVSRNIIEFLGSAVTQKHQESLAAVPLVLRKLSAARETGKKESNRLTKSHFIGLCH